MCIRDSIELGIVQDIRQRNLFGNRLSSRCGRSLGCLADGRLGRLRRYRLSGSHRCLSRLHRLSMLCGLSRRHALSALRLNRLLLNRLARINRSLLYPLRLCRSTRCTGGSSGAALLVEEYATAANRLETARALLTTFLAVSRRRLGRTGSSRTSRDSTRRMSRCRSRCFRVSSYFGSLS